MLRFVLILCVGLWGCVENRPRTTTLPASPSKQGVSVSLQGERFWVFEEDDLIVARSERVDNHRTEPDIWGRAHDAMELATGCQVNRVWVYVTAVKGQVTCNGQAHGQVTSKHAHVIEDHEGNSHVVHHEHAVVANAEETRLVRSQGEIVVEGPRWSPVIYPGGRQIGRDSAWCRAFYPRRNTETYWRPSYCEKGQ